MLTQGTIFNLVVNTNDFMSLWNLTATLVHFQIGSIGPRMLILNEVDIKA